MTPMRIPGVVLLLGVLLSLAACSTTQPEWLREETEACFRPRSFTDEIPQMYWGDPVRDPCWRFRRVLPPDR
jgi:hypothetical protein